LTAAIRLDPKDPELLTKRAKGYFVTDKYEFAARADFLEAIPKLNRMITKPLRGISVTGGGVPMIQKFLDAKAALQTR